MTILSSESDTVFYHGFLVHFLVLCRDSTVAPRTGQKLLTLFAMEKHIVFYHGFFENWTRFWSRRQRRITARPSSNSASDFWRTASNSLACIGIVCCTALAALSASFYIEFLSSPVPNPPALAREAQPKQVPISSKTLLVPRGLGLTIDNIQLHFENRPFFSVSPSPFWF